MDKTPPVTRVTIELELHPRLASTSEEPAGEVVTPGGERHSFVGWMELASAIEDWRQAEAQAPTPPTGAR